MQTEQNLIVCYLQYFQWYLNSIIQQNHTKLLLLKQVAVYIRALKWRGKSFWYHSFNVLWKIHSDINVLSHNINELWHFHIWWTQEQVQSLLNYYHQNGNKWRSFICFKLSNSIISLSLWNEFDTNSNVEQLRFSFYLISIEFYWQLPFYTDGIDKEICGWRTLQHRWSQHENSFKSTVTSMNFITINLFIPTWTRSYDLIYGNSTKHCVEIELGSF